MTRPLRSYLAAHTTRSPTLAPDGTLAVRGDTTGTMQIWTLDEPGHWPQQRTFYENRISTIAWGPDGRRLLYSRDTGGDEHDQLFLWDRTQNTHDQLTDQPEAIHSWGSWGPAGDRIAFTANRDVRDRFDVYLMAPTPEATPRRVHTGEGRIFVSDWSSTGDELLVGTAHGSSSYDLSVLDLQTETVTQRTQPDVAARYLAGHIGPDGGIYCLSDLLTDTLSLVYLPPDGGEPTVVLTGGEWSIDGFVFSPTTGRFAYTRNVDGYSELHRGQLTGRTTAETSQIETPSGVITGLDMGPESRRVAMTLSATNQNYASFVADLETGTVTQWTTPSPGGRSLDAYHDPELIRYETFDGREIPAFMSVPAGAEPVPVIVDIHGGPHSQRRPSWRNRPVRQYFIDQGYAIFEPNVRGSSGYGREYAALDDVENRMDSVRDIKAGVEYLHEHPRVDNDRIVSYGRSYGGFMVLATITEYPELWAAAVEFVGIANWVTFLENTGSWRRAHREAEYGSLAEDREFLESISPIHKVDQIETPLFIQHGANDPRVPVDESRQIAAALEQRNVPVETCIFEDEGHHTTKRENRIEQFEQIAAFLAEHV